jgi:glycosyltransferase involved in cell wall biosynthesis
MLISIIIPTHNRPYFLAQCLAAISGQTRNDPDVEILAVDDGSDPEFAAANKNFCSAHGAIYHRLDKNRGMAVARNKGIAHSTGEWLVFIDDDFRVADNWLTMMKKTLCAQPESVVGVEGRIDPVGRGLWDNEVQNQKGGLYLTCHIAYRKYLIDMIAGFDPQFEFEGPFCEDHEIAVRMLRHGLIVFEPRLRGVHLPRRMKLTPYFFSSFKRVRTLLAAEYYFFCKQGDWYHRFRHSRTFWGTYLSVLVRNLVNNVRRRRSADCLCHPVQFFFLVAASIVEQIGAWLLVPHYAWVLIKNEPRFFHRLIDEERTNDFWHFRDRTALRYLRFRFLLLASLFFPLIKKPVYDIRPMLRRLSAFRTITDSHVLLRIDDIFLNETAVVDRFIEIMGRKKYPFLAGVTGDDLLNISYAPMINRLRGAGAEIAVHGFSHQGHFGPFASELLQMNYPDFLNKLVAISGAAVFRNNPPQAFIPPFNAVAGEQISFLARHFAIITGGSETMRFTDHFAGPVAMKEGGWYVPVAHPYYNKASLILRAGLMEQLARTKGFVCLALHMTEEENDDFAGLIRLLDALPIRPLSWQIFTKANSGTS